MPGQMQIYGDPRTSAKVTRMISIFEETDLFKLLDDVYEGNPVPLEQHVRLIPIEVTHPQDTPYKHAQFQHSVVEQFFVSAYERNKERLTSFTETQHSLKDEAEFVRRMRIANDKDLASKYLYSRERTSGVTSHELPYIIYTFIDQLTREDTKLLPAA